MFSFVVGLGSPGIAIRTSQNGHDNTSQEGEIAVVMMQPNMTLPQQVMAIAIGWRLCGFPTSQPRVHPTKSIVVDRGKEGVDECIGGHENGWRARITKAGVNAMDGASGCY